MYRYERAPDLHSRHRRSWSLSALKRIGGTSQGFRDSLPGAFIVCNIFDENLQLAIPMLRHANGVTDRCAMICQVDNSVRFCHRITPHRARWGWGHWIVSVEGASIQMMRAPPH
jgi:hypothetical protein